jgi:hypothetical protein
LMRQFFQKVQKEKYDELVEKVIQRDLSPYEAIKILLIGDSEQET